MPVELRTKAILEEREKKLQKMREQLQEKQAKLSFKPEITHFEFKEKQRQPFYDSLDEKIQKRREFYQSIELLKERKEKEEATFAPAISTYSKQLERGDEPIHERLFKLSKSMTADNQSTHPELTFQPTISTATITLAAQVKQREGPISDRLYNEAQEMESKRKSIMDEIEKQERMKMQPKVSTSTKTYYKSKMDKMISLVFQQIDSQSKGHINYKQFGEGMKRLGLFMSGDSQVQRRTEQEVRIHEKLWRVIDPKEEGSIEFDSFKKIVLVILDPSAIVDEVERQSLWSELKDEIQQLHLNRLAYSKTEKHERNMEELRKLRDKELTFKPKINENSIQIEQSKPYLALGRLLSQANQSTQSMDQSMNTSIHVEREPTTENMDVPNDENSVISSIQQPSKAWSEESMSASMEQHNSIVKTPRYEQLLLRQKELSKRKEMERMQKIEKEMKECTFQPKIIKSKNLDRRKKASNESHFDFLYKQNSVPKKYTIVDVRPHQEKELEECTFKPMRAHTKKYDKILEKKRATSALDSSRDKESFDTSPASNSENSEGAPPTDPKQTPRGYKEYIERIRKANEAEKFDYHKSLREGLKTEVKPKSTKTTEFKPFNFQLNREKIKPKPLLFMDVNMGPGKTGRISIHEGDDPNVLASNFAQMYKLDSVLTSRLAELIRENIERSSATTPQDAEEERIVPKTRSKTPPAPTRSSPVNPSLHRSKSVSKDISRTSTTTKPVAAATVNKPKSTAATRNSTGKTSTTTTTTKPGAKTANGTAARTNATTTTTTNNSAVKNHQTSGVSGDVSQSMQSPQVSKNPLADSTLDLDLSIDMSL